MAIAKTTAGHYHQLLKHLFSGKLLRIERAEDYELGGYKLYLVLIVPFEDGLDEVGVYQRVSRAVNLIVDEPKG